MDFRKLTEESCGQSNPLSQLARNVTEGHIFHENIGNTSTLGSNQNNLMPPQTFQMNGDYIFGYLLSHIKNKIFFLDLLREIEQIEPQQVPMPTPSADVQIHSSLGAMGSTAYQNELHDIFDNNCHSEGFEIVPLYGFRGSIVSTTDLKYFVYNQIFIFPV